MYGEENDENTVDLVQSDNSTSFIINNEEIKNDINNKLPKTGKISDMILIVLIYLFGAVGVIYYVLYRYFKYL